MRLVIISAIYRGIRPRRAFESRKNPLESLHAAEEFWRDADRPQKAPLELTRAHAGVIGEGSDAHVPRGESAHRRGEKWILGPGAKPQSSHDAFQCRHLVDPWFSEHLELAK